MRMLSGWEISALKVKAHELDINNGGHFDARSGCINVWAAEDNHPPGPGWEGIPFLKGHLNYARNFVGTISLGDLSVSTMNYEAMRRDHGPTGVYGEAAAPYVNQPGDIAWAREQFTLLWKAALNTPAPELVVKR